MGPEIQVRIERYAASEIRFNLMALVRDRRSVAREQLAKATSLQDRITGRLSGRLYVHFGMPLLPH